MYEMLLTLFSLVWSNEYVSTYRKDGLIVSLFKKGDREGPGNYRGITLPNVIGKLYSKVLNNRLLKYLGLTSCMKGRGFRIGRSCIDNIFS